MSCLEHLTAVIYQPRSSGKIFQNTILFWEHYVDVHTEKMLRSGFFNNL